MISQNRPRQSGEETQHNITQSPKAIRGRSLTKYHKNNNESVNISLPFWFSLLEPQSTVLLLPQYLRDSSPSSQLSQTKSRGSCILNFSSCTRQPWTCVREGGAVRTWSSDSLFFFLFPFSFILNESNQLENALFEEWTFGPFLK